MTPADEAQLVSRDLSDGRTTRGDITESSTFLQMGVTTLKRNEPTADRRSTASFVLAGCEGPGSTDFFSDPKEADNDATAGWDGDDCLALLLELLTVLLKPNTENIKNKIRKLLKVKIN